jgi:outer membrane receptor protein involved in Fe transport
VPALRWNQFGASLGGPAIKDKLFWFGDYQGTRQRLGASESLRLPTAAERSGDLSDLGVPIFDPLTGNSNGTGRSQFPGSVIPTGRISGPALQLLSLLPEPNLTPANPADPNYVTSTSGSNDDNQFDIRADHYLTQNFRYFARYSYLGADITYPGPLGLFGGTPFPAFNVSGHTSARNQNLVGSANYTPTPTWLGEFRFGYSRYRVLENSLDSTVALADQIGIPGLNIPGRPDTLGLPDLNINGTGGFQAGYRCNCPLDEREFIYDFVTNWAKVHGNHEFKFGATYEFAGNRRLPSDNHRSGVYDFNPSTTSLAPGIGGLGLASFLLGEPFDFSRFQQISTTQEDRQNRMFFFVQDTWRITPKLTLSPGLRWDTWFPDYSLNAGQGGRYDVTTNIVYIPGVGSVSQSANSQTQWHNFSPRLGIAYAFTPKTVVRTGFGQSYYQGTFGWTFNNLAADIYPSIANQSLTAPSPFQAVFPLTQAPPAVTFPTIPSNGMLPLPDGISTPYIPANQKIPYVYQWNLTIEHELPSHLNLSLGYVGNVARHLNSGFGLNAAVPGPGPFDPRRPLFNLYGLTQGIFDKCDCSSSNYNAFQVRGEKRFSSGYSLVASYTYSRTLDFGEFGTPTDQYNTRLDYGPADFNRAHTLTIAHTWDLPFGKGRRFMASAGGFYQALLGGWAFSGITSYASGLPLSPTLSNNASLNSDMSLRPDQNGNPTADISQNRNQWFNPAVFSVPGAFLFGDASRNSIVGPNVFVANWALDKSFNLTERAHLQFRWELFNAFNRTNLGQPNNSVDTPEAGLITDINSSYPMRNMQWGVHITW